MIDLFGIPTAFVHILVPALAVALLAFVVSFGMTHFTSLSGFGLKLASVLTTQVVFALILAALVFITTGEIRNAEDRMAQSFAVFFSIVAWVVGFVVSIPAVHFAIEYLTRK